MKKVSSVKKLKLLIDNVILPSYKYKMNLSSPEFLVDINSKFIIIAKPFVKILGFIMNLCLIHSFYLVKNS